MPRSILTVPFAFLINVSSLILSWLLILPLQLHCTKVKDTVHYCTVTYMLLIWRTFSCKNGVNSKSQYLAVQHVLFIYRDGTIALARTSGHVLTNPDNMAVFLVKTQVIRAAEDTTAVCLPADPPAHGRQKE